MHRLTSIARGTCVAGSNPALPTTKTHPGGSSVGRAKYFSRAIPVCFLQKNTTGMNILYQIILGFMIVVMDILLSAVFIMMSGMLLYALFHKWREKSKWNRLYKSIQIGDRFIQEHQHDDPYLQRWGGIVFILGKMKNKDGVPYVLYSEQMTEAMALSSPLELFIKERHYIPYNNQDKKQ